jgi:hypothetical protein
LDEQGLRIFLQGQRRSENTIKRCIKFTKIFASYLSEFKGGKPLESAERSDVEDFVVWCDGTDRPVKAILWGIRYYYQYRENEPMQQIIGNLRAGRIQRKPLALRDIRGVNLAIVERLAAEGIQDVEKMLLAGRTPSLRLAIANQTGVPLDAITELVKLSDLARIPGVKGIRARLYYDAGIDSIVKMAKWDSAGLRAMLVEFVDQTGFDGIAPWPKEAGLSVEFARRLPVVTEFEDE